MEYILINDSLEKKKRQQSNSKVTNTSVDLNSIHLLNNENFISLINSLSRNIKNYVINEKSILKEAYEININMTNLFSQFTEMTNQIELNKSFQNRKESNELKSTIKTITGNITRGAELISKLEKYDTIFYQEAKEIFKKMKYIQIKSRTHSIIEHNQKKDLSPTKIKPKMNSCIKKKIFTQTINHSHHRSLDKPYKRCYTNSDKSNDFAPKGTEINILKTLSNLNNSFSNIYEGRNTYNYLVNNSSQLGIEGNTSMLNNTIGLSNTFGDINDLIENKILNKDGNDTHMSIKKDKKTKLNLSLKPKKNFSLNKKCVNTGDNNSSLCNKLASDTIDFILNMKKLQEAITKKKGDVSLMKKQFEKQKKELYELAVSIDKNSKEQDKNKSTEKVHKIFASPSKNEGTNQSSLLKNIKIKELEKTNLELVGKIEELKKENKNHESLIYEKNEELKKILEKNENFQKENEKINKTNTFLISEVGSTKLQIEKCTKDMKSMQIMINDIYTNLLDKLKDLNIPTKCTLSNITGKVKTKKIQDEIIQLIQLIPKELDKTNSSSKQSSQFILEENKKLKQLFEECTVTISNCIKEAGNQISIDHSSNVSEDNDNDMSFNYVSGGNNSVNLVDSVVNSKRDSANSTIDKENVKSAVDNFKKYIQATTKNVKKLKEENDELKIAISTYKDKIDKVINGKDQKEKEFSITFNNLTKTFTFKDVANESSQYEVKEHNPLYSPGCPNEKEWDN